MWIIPLFPMCLFINGFRVSLTGVSIVNIETDIQSLTFKEMGTSQACIANVASVQHTAHIWPNLFTVKMKPCFTAIAAYTGQSVQRPITSWTKNDITGPTGPHPLVCALNIIPHRTPTQGAPWLLTVNHIGCFLARVLFCFLY